MLDADLATFRRALTEENHTLKRVLTDPRQFSGIGNAYSDEILHAAGLSPLAMSARLDDEQTLRLFESPKRRSPPGPGAWSPRPKKIPEKVTAFRPEMAAHGKYQQPCPVCATPIQRIRYADNETNYSRAARREDKFWPTAASRVCSARTFPAPSRTWSGCAGGERTLSRPSAFG